MRPLDLPVRDVLLLSGETPIAWGVFDAEWYRLAYKDSIATLEDSSDAALLAFYLELGQQLGHQPNRWFHEAWHRQAYPNIQKGVEEGRFTSAFDAYCRTGNVDRSPHWLFDAAYYRRRYADLSNEVLAEAKIANGYDHFLRHGSKEGRVGHVLFDPTFYLDALDPIDAEAAARLGPFQHYLIGLENGAPLRETGHYFAEAWYRARYPEVADAIAAGIWGSGLEHYLSNDNPMAFDPSSEFSEQWYLTGHPGLRDAIEAGSQRNGYAHFLRHGAMELRTPAPHIDLRWYAAREAVRDSLLHDEATDAYAHWLKIGKHSGHLSARPLDERISESQARALWRGTADALIATYARTPIRFQRVSDPALSVVMIVDRDLVACLASLVSLRANTAEPIELVLIVTTAGADAGDIGRFVAGAVIQRLDASVSADAAAQIGVACAHASSVLFLQPGIDIAPGSIAAATARIQNDPTIAAVGGKVLRPHGPLRSAGHCVWSDGTTHGYMNNELPTAPEANFVRDVHFCGSTFLLVRRDVLGVLRDGGAQAPTTEANTADLCLRAIAAGYRVVFDPAVAVRAWATPDLDINARISTDTHAVFLADCYPPDGRLALFARRADQTKKRVLFIEETLPIRAIGSGFVRSNDLIWAMSAAGYAVTVFPINGSRFDIATVYADMPDNVEVIHDQNLSRLAEFLRLRRGLYDTIWVARTHNLDRIRPILNRVTAGDPTPPLIVLDTEAIRSVRDAIRAELDGLEFDRDAALRREFANAELCRAVVAVNSEEVELLRGLGLPDVHLIGHARRLQPTERPFARRAGLLFAGAIHRMDSPNYDSLCWFVDDVLPIVERGLRWETRLTIAGYLAPEVNLDRFQGHPRVTLRGTVADLTPLYASHRLFVAPTRFAAGTPYKVHEAASFGLPVVASTLLGRQLGWTDGEDLLVADTRDAAGFAACIIRLYRDEALWTRLRDAALDRLQRENNPEDYQAAVRAILD